MIRLRVDGDEGQPPVCLLGITDLNVKRLTAGGAIRVDLRQLGGHDVVVIFHGRDARGLRDQLATVLSPDALAAIGAGLDQLEAMEKDDEGPTA